MIMKKDNSNKWVHIPDLGWVYSKDFLQSEVKRNNDAYNLSILTITIFICGFVLMILMHPINFILELGSNDLDYLFSLVLVLLSLHHIFIAKELKKIRDKRQIILYSGSAGTQDEDGIVLVHIPKGFDTPVNEIQMEFVKDKVAQQGKEQSLNQLLEFRQGQLLKIDLVLF